MRVITRTETARTEGLFFEKGHLIESSGSPDSSLNSIDVDTGKVTKLASTEGDSFGEGLARHGSELIQLTYEEGKIYIYDAQTFRLKRVATNTFSREGWGLTTYDANTLIATDGTGKLFFVDANTLALKKTVDLGMPWINALEHVGRFVYANRYTGHYPFILKFDLDSLCLDAMIDLSKLYPLLSRKDLLHTALDPDVVPNGIAYDPKEDVFYVTGKSWSKIFVIKLGS